MRIVYCIAGTYNSGGMERVLANKANIWSVMDMKSSLSPPINAESNPSSVWMNVYAVMTWALIMKRITENPC